MTSDETNYYGSLCTQMYEILHSQAPTDELNFYLSYAEKGMKILEPMCGSGRFFIPFMQRGFDITGIDNSSQMLAELLRKAPSAKVACADLERYRADTLFDYIFITSGSVSLFTDTECCRRILFKLKNMLADGGKFVFAVDTVAVRCPDDEDYVPSISVKTKENYDLTLKTKNFFDIKSQTQFSPGIYELYDGGVLLKSEAMEFQTHLYRYGEMERILKDIGFSNVAVYSSFDKKAALSDRDEMFLYECDA